MIRKNLSAMLVVAILINFAIYAPVRAVSSQNPTKEFPSYTLPADIEMSFAGSEGLVGNYIAPGKHALWLQIGFGSSFPTINYNYQPSDFMHVETSLHFRRNHSLLSIGLDGEVTDCWGVNSTWGTYDYSIYTRYSDVSASAGLALTEWYYHTEGERGTIRSDLVPGLLFKLQVMPHLPQLLGIGIVATINLNREAT